MIQNDAYSTTRPISMHAITNVDSSDQRRLSGRLRAAIRTPNANKTTAMRTNPTKLSFAVSIARSYPPVAPARLDRMEHPNSGLKRPT